MYQETTAYKKISKLTKRYRGIAGGSSASKTISILQWLTDYAQTHDKNVTISVVSETMPHLRKGAIRDFTNILSDHKYFDDNKWNKTDSIYDFSDSGHKKFIEFFSADQSGKVRGPRRDILFINEANNISYETFTQLEIRTNDIVILDWNPVTEFWWYQGENGETPVMNRPNAETLILTYLDNEGCPESIKQSLLSHKNNKNWWNIYGLGIPGVAEGRIYKDWQIVDDVPFDARLYRKGLDFGYTNDPSALVAAYKYNDGYILDEELYQRGMTNNQIADFVKNLPQTLIKADSAEPKSIEEIKQYGINILPVTKGKDSVRQGIQFVQDQRISVTKRSINLLKEYRNYLWVTDIDGKILNEPEGGFEHCMDAIRYLFDEAIVNQQKVQTYNKRKWVI
jgi:phage terminase large subunit